MRSEITQLIEISRFYGSSREYVIAGGGNISYKDEKTLWIKASGYQLGSLTEDGLVAIDREKLGIISIREYSDDPLKREEEIISDLSASMHEEYRGKRPSVETSLHNLIRYRFVVHLHPAVVNGLLCSRNANSLCAELFGDKVLFVRYADPGYVLFKKLENEIIHWRKKYNSDPKIILAENHGSFVSADSIEEIRDIYDEIIHKISSLYEQLPDTTLLPFDPVLEQVFPALRMMLSENKPKVIRHRYNALIDMFSTNQQQFQKISHPLTPDMIVFCRPRYIFIEQSSNAERILESLKNQLEKFRNEYGFDPRIIVIKGMGVVAVEDNFSAAEQVLDVYEYLIKVSYYASLCGGIKLLSPEQVDLIDKKEVENYRRRVLKVSEEDNKLLNKIAIVTGTAQGFGAGIADALFREGMNIMIADIDEDKGRLLADSLNTNGMKNRALFTKTDVSDPVSVRELVHSTVREFGGLDLMIINNTILMADSLEETDSETFKQITETNYNSFFYCTKYASEVMKIQNREKPEYFTDIIYIDSKSELKGSSRNYAYAGAMYGTIGLLQSFALELASFRIKVNYICPGNFFDGPVWSDPVSGFFVRLLKTGKVPGARNIEDVKRYCEEQVPLGRGCSTEDVVKAIVYAIDQEYETGQVIPVTGGQIMLK